MASLLHVIDTGGPGGAETVFLTLAAGLDSQGQRTVAVVSREGWLAEQVRAHGLEPVIESGRGGFNRRYLGALLGLVRRHRPAAIVSHLYGASVYCALAGLLTHTPVIAVLHGQTDVATDDRLAAAKAAILRAGCKRVVFVSEALRNDLSTRLRLPPSRCAVIPNGVDLERFDAGQTGPLRAELDLADGTLLVGAIGNIRRPKGYDHLLRAARAVLDQGVDAHFVVAGEPKEPLYGELVDLRRELALERFFTFLGLRDDVPDVLRGLDMFVTSSTTEGFSIACIEAMACRLAVVATRSGGPETILEDGRTGLLVPASDPTALASAIVALARDPARRQALGHAARRAVEERYSSRSLVAAYAQLVDSAANDRVTNR